MSTCMCSFDFELHKFDTLRLNHAEFSTVILGRAWGELALLMGHSPPPNPHPQIKGIMVIGQ